MSTTDSTEKLGIGLTYQPGLQPAMDAAGPLIDFYEVSPDILCRECVRDGRRTLDYHPELLREALRRCEDRPVVVHGLGLSIGTAAGWNESYLEVLDRFCEHRWFPWHSEHIGFLQATDADGAVVHAGVQLPVPFTEEALSVIAPRARALVERYERPFLLENTTFYLPGIAGEHDEVTFLNELARRSGCGLLLDLYNLHCNAVNFGFDALDALSRLDLERVGEIHVAGGVESHGFLMDVHSDVVPEPVWELLAWVVPRAPNLRGIVYELLEQALRVVGAEGVRRELEHAHAIWETRPRGPRTEASDVAA